jgi:hypothetical protein
LWVAIVLCLRVGIFVLFTLLLLILVVPVVGILLWRVPLLLLALLWPESCDVLLRGRVCRFLLLVDDVDHGPLLPVSFNPVVGEEGLVSIVDCHSGLILVREQLPYVFWSSCSEYLCEEEFVVGPNAVVGKGCEIVLSVCALWLQRCWPFWFDSV